MKTIYQNKEDKKFTKSIKLDDYQILTDDGYVDIEYLHETIPYEVWELKLSNGYELKCADDHIVFDNNMNEIFVKNLEIGDKIKTDEGYAIVISNQNLNYTENMYDFQLIENSNKRYLTNGILSHNTELAKQIAKYLFDSEDALIRLDMSEFMEKISISRIQGSAPGYVGYDDANFLDKIRRKPYSVVLFDEIEKAHSDIFNIFLQMLDEGSVTDSHGRKVSFKNCVILMTSNVGTRVVKDFGSGIGFASKHKEENKNNDVKNTLEGELKKKFSPEFLNRLDEIIYFNDLSKEDIIKIIDIELDKTKDKAEKIGIKLTIDQSLIEHLSIIGYNKEYGARPLKRAIQKWLDDYITEFVIENNIVDKSVSLNLSYNAENDITDIKVIPEKKKRK